MEVDISYEFGDDDIANVTAPVEGGVVYSRVQHTFEEWGLHVIGKF